MEMCTCKEDGCRYYTTSLFNLSIGTQTYERLVPIHICKGQYQDAGATSGEATIQSDESVELDIRYQALKEQDGADAVVVGDALSVGERKKQND